MARKFNIAIAGATGLVGEALREILPGRDFPAGDVYLLASSESAGKRLEYGGKRLGVKALEDFDFSQVQLVFSALPAEQAVEVARRAREAGAVVIDCSGAFLSEPRVPQVVPEVNPQRLDDFRQTGVVASPSPAAIQLARVLHIIAGEAGLEGFHATVLEPASAAGRRGMEELAAQTARLLNGQPAEAEHFPARLAFNTHPVTGTVLDSGASAAEVRVSLETLSVLGEQSLPVTITVVRVPAFFGTAVTLHAETAEPLEVERLNALLAGAVGIDAAAGEAAGGPSAVEDAVGSDQLLVGRVRRDLTRPRGLNLWLVTDNLRKGAALNCVQIAELLLKDHL